MFYWGSCTTTENNTSNFAEVAPTKLTLQCLIGVESTRHALLPFLIWQGYTVYSECMCAIYVDCPEYLNCPGNSWMPFTFQPALQKERALMLTDWVFSHFNIIECIMYCSRNYGSWSSNSCFQRLNKLCPVDLCEFVVALDRALCDHFLSEHTWSKLSWCATTLKISFVYWPQVM